MFVFTAKVSKWKCLAIAAILVVAIVLIVRLFSSANTQADAALQTEQHHPETVSSNEERIAYLASFGWEVSPDPVETQEVRIPETFPEVLEQYNRLQQEQGFDLTNYAGKLVKRYVYEILNHPDSGDSYRATLLIYKDTVIGADVASTAQNGTMRTLTMPQH